MENNQSPQHSSQSSHIQVAQSKARWHQQASLNFLLKLIQHNPWLVWIGVGAFLFFIISTSISSIINVGYVKDEPAAVKTSPTSSSSPTGSAVPLWLLGTVALGCATGSIAIAKRRQISSQLSRLHQHLQFASTQAIARRQQRKLMLQSRQQMLIPPAQVKTAKTAAPVQPSPANLMAEEKILLQEENQPLSLKEESQEQLLIEEIVFLSQETQTLSLVQESEAEENLVAAETESLVEMLDIRKKLPLSVILGDSDRAEE